MAYAEGVPQPFINVEERVDRAVGRTGTPRTLSTTTSRRADAVAWRRAFGGIRVARGVYRFATHEEADEWLWKTIARPARS